MDALPTIGSAPFKADGVTPAKGVGGITLASGTIPNGNVFSNVMIGDANVYGTVSIGQAIGSGGNIATGPITIQAGGMYNGAALTAGGNVVVNAPLTTTNQPISLLAGSAVSGTLPTAVGSVAVSNATLNSSGGAITVANARQVSGVGIAGLNSGQGVSLSSATLNAGNGNISVLGESNQIGANLSTTTLQTSGTGSLQISGYSICANNCGIFELGTALSNSTLVTDSGNLSIIGATNARSASVNGPNGIIFGLTGSTNKIYSGSGDITLKAASTFAGTPFKATSGSSYLGWDGIVGSGHLTTGNITLSGADNGAQVAATESASLSALKINSNGGGLTIGSLTSLPWYNGSTQTLGGYGFITLGAGGLTLTSGSSFDSVSLGDNNTYGTVTVNQALGGGVPGVSGVSLTGPVAIQAGGFYNGTLIKGYTNGTAAINLNSNITTTGDVLVNAISGDLPINTTISTTSTTPDAIVLAAGSNTLSPTSTGGNVTLGTNGVLTTGSGGRIAVYSGSVAGTTGFSTLVNNSYRYSRNYADDSAFGTSGAWLAYREGLNLTFTLSNAILNSIYNGTSLNQALFSTTLANYASVTGFVNGDSLSNLVLSGSLAFGPSGTVVGNAGNYAITVGSLASNLNYGIVLTPATYTITPAPLTVTAVTNTKNYDGTTASASTPTITSGQLFGDGITLSQSYATQHANTGITLTPLAVINDGNKGNNYSVTYVNDTTGVINPAMLTVTGSGNLSKTYDGTTATTGTTAAVSAANYNISGLINGDSASLTNTSALYDNAHVANASVVNVSGLSLANISGTNNSATSDYVLNNNNVTIAAAITPLAVTVNSSISGPTTKVYDGTTNAPIGTSVSVSGVNNALAGDTFTLDSTNIKLSYNDAHVVLANALNVSGVQIAGITSTTYNSQLSDYTISTPPSAPVVATITAAPLTVTAVAYTKTYDGTTSAAGIPTITSGQLFGNDMLIASEVYDNKNVGTNKTLIPVTQINGLNNNSDYAVSYVNNTSGVIEKADLTLAATPQTKVFDGTTTAAAVPTYNAQGQDTVTNLSESYDSPNIGVSKTLTVDTGFIINDGNGGNNYNVHLLTALGDITQAGTGGTGTGGTGTGAGSGIGGFLSRADNSTGRSGGIGIGGAVGILIGNTGSNNSALGADSNAANGSGNGTDGGLWGGGGSANGSGNGTDGGLWGGSAAGEGSGMNSNAGSGANRVPIFSMGDDGSVAEVTAANSYAATGQIALIGGGESPVDVSSSGQPIAEKSATILLVTKKNIPSDGATTSLDETFSVLLNGSPMGDYRVASKEGDMVIVEKLSDSSKNDNGPLPETVDNLSVQSIFFNLSAVEKCSGCRFAMQVTGQGRVTVSAANAAAHQALLFVSAKNKIFPALLKAVAENVKSRNIKINAVNIK